jgi:DNA-binding NarL/FixJ family response regulator
MTNNEIAQKLFVSVTTVDTHRKNLLTKLSARNTAELVRLAFFHKFISL